MFLQPLLHLISVIVQRSQTPLVHNPTIKHYVESVREGSKGSAGLIPHVVHQVWAWQGLKLQKLPCVRRLGL